MNKHKRRQINNRIRFVKRLASEVKPFDPQYWTDGENNDFIKKANRWYTQELTTPLYAANTIKLMKGSRCQRLAWHLLRRLNGYEYGEFYGNHFTEKFTMCIFTRNDDWMRRYAQFESSYVMGTKAAQKLSVPVTNKAIVQMSESVKAFADHQTFLENVEKVNDDKQTNTA